MTSWLTGYNRRVKVPVNYTVDGAKTNYPMILTIVKSTGSNAAGTIYLQDEALNWPNDIRFTSSDGSTEIDHWRMESDSTDGTWYMEAPSIAASGETDFYLYYRKTSGADGSNMRATFANKARHFDDNDPTFNPSISIDTLTTYDVTYPRLSCPRVATMTNGDTLMVFNKSESNVATQTYSSVWGKVYDSSEDTWGDDFIIVDHGSGYSYGAIEGGLIVLSTGKVLLHYLKWTSTTDSKIRQIESSDYGATWSGDAEISTGFDYNCTANNGIIMSDGKLIFPFSYNNSSYPTWNMRSAIMYSTNSGSSWTIGGTAGHVSGAGTYGEDEPTVIERSDGSLLMYCRTNEGHIWYSTSTDDGVTWANVATTGIVSPSNAQSGSTCELYRVSMSPDIVYLTWNWNASNRYPLNAAVSYDGGVTWPGRKQIVNPFRAVCMGSYAIANDGDIIYVYWDHLSDTTDDIKWFKTDRSWLEDDLSGDLGSVTITSSEATLSGNAKCFKTAWGMSIPTVMEMRVKTQSATIADVVVGWGNQLDDPTYTYLPNKGVVYYQATSAANNKIYTKKPGASWTAEETNWEATLNSYQVRKFVIVSDSATQIYYDGTSEINSVTDCDATVADMFLESRTSCNVIVDWVLFRQYTANPPTWATPGSLESLPTASSQVIII